MTSESEVHDWKAEAEELREIVRRLRSRLVALARALPPDSLGLLQMSTAELIELARDREVLESGTVPTGTPTTARAELEHLWALLAPPGEP